MTDRSHLGPVTMNDQPYPSVRAALMAIGYTQAQRREPRKEVRRTGEVTVRVGNTADLIVRSKG